jgi:very-short-patch-repair endonuclease
VAEAVDRAIAAIALRQQGNITVPQLHRLGLDKHAIAYRVRIGRLHRVHAGVYSVGRPPLTAVEKASAAVLACGPGAALSHFSALWLWGFVNRWPPQIEVAVARHRRPRGIVVHRMGTLTGRDLRRHQGIAVTSLARALLDCAPRMRRRALARAVDDALRSPFLTRSQLADVCNHNPRHPGAGPLAWFIDTSDGPSRSDWEREFPVFCERFVLPRPQINAQVCGYEVDAYFEAEGLIVELDGWGFHQGRRSFESDRDRDADTLAAGLATVRITSQRMTETPGREAERLRAILARRHADRRPRPGD